MSSISIIGVGSMASALAGRALAGDNRVEIIGADPAKAKALAAALGGATVGTVGTAPAGAPVGKAFNTVPCDVLAAGSIEGRPVDVFTASGDAQANARVSVFIESLGMHPMDAGQLPMARALEHATLLHLGLVAHSVTHTNFFLGVN